MNISKIRLVEILIIILSVCVLVSIAVKCSAQDFNAAKWDAYVKIINSIDEWRTLEEERIFENCKVDNTSSFFGSSGRLFPGVRSAEINCMLSQLYGMNKVMNMLNQFAVEMYLDTRPAGLVREDFQSISGIIEDNLGDWVTTHLKCEEYLEGREN